MDNKVYSKKNKFKKNSTFKFNFNLKKQLLRTTKTSVLLLNNFENQKFIMLISSNESLEKLVKISSIYPKNKILFKPIQSGSCKGLNPFNNNNSIDYAFLICKDYNHHVFKNILESRKINLLNFKNALKTFLKNYSKLNREIGFVYNNINKSDLNYSYTRNIDPILGKIQDYPDVAANGDTVFIVWQDNRDNIPDCFLSYSTSGVEGLSLGIKFTDTTISAPKLNPHVIYKNNWVHIVYNHNGLNSVEYVRGSFGQLSAIDEIKKDKVSNINFDILGRKSNNPFNKIIIK